MADEPKRTRGRPRVHATPEAAREAARARANASTRARRAERPDVSVPMTDATRVQADALVAHRRLAGLGELVEALVAEETARVSVAVES